LPKFGARVLIRFSSLRTHGGLQGVTFDCDEMVQRVCRRVHCDGGWKWQIVNYEKMRLWHGSTVDQDKEILDMYTGEEIDAEIVRVL
jgi:hypothetical protein